MDTQAERQARYSNFFKIGYNEFELVIDFGQAYSDGGCETIHTRIVTTVPYANALLELLSVTLRDHAGKFGTMPTCKAAEES